MNYRLVSRFLGILSIFFGIFMLFSLPWAHSTLGQHTDPKVLASVADLQLPGSPIQDPRFERAGFNALVFSSVTCLLLGALLMSFGRGVKVQLFRREAMAIVGLSWILATFLGALPFWLSGTVRGPSIRVFDASQTEPGVGPVVLTADTTWWHWEAWERVDHQFTPEQMELLHLLVDHNEVGVSRKQLRRALSNPNVELVFEELQAIPKLTPWLIAPGTRAPSDRIGHYRIRWVKMTWADCLFESQSGFSTTGATVISDLEDPNLVPHCILFWRSSSHFLGGLGIIVLFVAVLGHGSAGKALMRAEMPGPSKEGSTERMQHTAWIFAVMYTGLNAVLTVLLKIMGMTWFDAICHAFGTMATGGFSTYNASLGHFDSPLIQYTVTVFMILAGTNFTLLYFLVLLKPLVLIRDLEWRTYIGIISTTTLVIVIVGMFSGDPGFDSFSSSMQYSLFQVVSVVTTTGYGTNDFDQWNQLSRVLLLLIMFVGGCAGSTGGGMKVIRHVLFAKILRLEMLRAYRPRLVKPLLLGEQIIDDPAMRKGIPVYFCFVFGIFAASWVLLVAIEPDSTWGIDPANKLIDTASAICATLHNIGPGLGTVGPATNYGHFTSLSKCIFTLLMMLGRLEIYPILVLGFPSFWRSR